MKIVMFSGNNCHGCNNLQPILEDVCNKIGADLTVLKREENPVEFGRHNIMSIPVTMVFKNDKPYWSYTGSISKAELTSKLVHLKEKLGE